MTPDQARGIAERRLEEITYAETRIKRKIADEHPRKADLEKRLAEYEVSKKAIELTLRSGTVVRVQDRAQMALLSTVTNGEVPAPSEGVVISPPAGELKLEGKQHGS